MQTVQGMKMKENENGCERNFEEDFLKNYLGELTNSSSRRLTNDCYGKITQQFASEGIPIYLPKLGVMFSRTKTLCFENDVFIAFGLGMREGVSECSRSGKG